MEHWIENFRLFRWVLGACEIFSNIFSKECSKIVFSFRFKNLICLKIGGKTILLSILVAMSRENCCTSNIKPEGEKRSDHFAFWDQGLQCEAKMGWDV